MSIEKQLPAIHLTPLEESKFSAIKCIYMFHVAYENAHTRTMVSIFLHAPLINEETSSLSHEDSGMNQHPKEEPAEEDKRIVCIGDRWMGF